MLYTRVTYFNNEDGNLYVELCERETLGSEPLTMELINEKVVSFGRIVPIKLVVNESADMCEVTNFVRRNNTLSNNIVFIS